MLIPICFAAVALLQAQVAKQSVPENPISDADGITSKSATNGFFRGRLLPGKSSAELRRRAFKAKLSMRAQHALLPYALWLFLPGVVIGWAALRNDAKRKIHRLRSIIVLVHVTLSLLSCGCVSTGEGTTSSSGNQLVTDYITVTGAWAAHNWSGRAARNRAARRRPASPGGALHGRHRLRASLRKIC